MLKTKTTMTALIALFVALGWTTPALAADAGLLKMRFTQSGNTSSSWPLYVAEQRKLFEKNGLQVEVIIIRGATNVVRAVLSETIPIGRINPDYVIGAADKGAKVKIVAANMEKIPYDIYARPEIKTGAELKGKTLGVSTLTGGTTLMVHEVLEKAYKLKENDYKRSSALRRSATPPSKAARCTPLLWAHLLRSAPPRTIFVSSPTFTNTSGKFFSLPTSRIRTTSIEPHRNCPLSKGNDRSDAVAL